MVTTGVDVRPRGKARDVAGHEPRRADDEPVRGALRALLSHIALPHPPRDHDEVVLSVDLHGVRYTLSHQRAPDDRPRVALSAREQEIARLISVGHTNKTIALVLEISLWTVDTHIRRIFAKLGVRSRGAMVAQLAEQGLIGITGESQISRA